MNVEWILYNCMRNEVYRMSISTEPRLHIMVSRKDVGIQLLSPSYICIHTPFSDISFESLEEFDNILMDLEFLLEMSILIHEEVEDD